MTKGVDSEVSAGTSFETITGEHGWALRSLSARSNALYAPVFYMDGILELHGFVSLAEVFYCQVPPGIQNGLAYVLIKAPLAENLEEALSAGRDRPGKDIVDADTLLSYCLLVPDRHLLQESAREWIARRILELAGAVLRRNIPSGLPARFSRQLIAFHCRAHEGFEDTWIDLVIRACDPSRKPPNGFGSYVSRGRKEVESKFGGVCPLDEPRNQSKVLRQILKEVHELRRIEREAEEAVR
jgi:hypothetical protein